MLEETIQRAISTPKAKSPTGRGLQVCLVLTTVTAEWAEHKLAIFKYGHAGVHKHRKYLYTACTPNLLVFLEGDSFFSLLADIKRM